MITRFRGDEGELIPKGRVAARRAIAALRRGTHLTLLADQKMDDGIPVPCFGHPAMTAPALAVLALRFDCDVLPAPVERLDGALSACRISAPAGNPKRRLSCRHRGADDPGQRDLGGVDRRPTGAMALGAPALAGLADYRPHRLDRGPPRPPLAEASAEFSPTVKRFCGSSVIHSSHAARRHSRCSLGLGSVADHRLGGDQQPCNRGGIL